MKSDRTLLKWYKKINKKFFDNYLPNNVLVRWANSEEESNEWEDKYFGEASYLDNNYHLWQIVLSRYRNDKACTKLSTLAHEMIHIATNGADDHGPAFEKWRQYISDRGFFKKHALIKNLTTF